MNAPRRHLTEHMLIFIIRCLPACPERIGTTRRVQRPTCTGARFRRIHAPGARGSAGHRRSQCVRLAGYADGRQRLRMCCRESLPNEAKQLLEASSRHVRTIRMQNDSLRREAVAYTTVRRTQHRHMLLRECLPFIALFPQLARRSCDTSLLTKTELDQRVCSFGDEQAPNAANLVRPFQVMFLPRSIHNVSVLLKAFLLTASTQRLKKESLPSLQCG